MTYAIAGSGIVGLYTALNLLEAGVKGSEIVVVAKHLPGDQSIEYTSPWAGGNFSCISPDDAETLHFDKTTYTHLAAIRSLLGPGCGLDKRPSTEYWEYQPDSRKIDSLKTYLEDFRVVPQTDLPEGVVFGIKYTSWNFNCPFFLENLKNYLEATGVVFIRQTIKQIDDLFQLASIVFNCTGIGAKTLGGAQDDNVYPARGQVVVIRAPHINENRMRWGHKNVTYIIPRPDSGSQVVLGGYLQKHNWCADTWKSETDDILKRTGDLFPETAEDREIVRVACGLRPSREGGVRVEKETRGAGTLVHVSGLSGYGYQAGYGAARRGVGLVQPHKL
ncbi:hypothetical protein OGAPHI_002557 [Ogataea philodendri]|uniref:FAD dependent oxidoreductase domain-containing protein n=1 Tax=Ogataea philodendri TaxID=1378263 RepID=A0A9P8PCK4_9ASCO|nr:uncharacterized protein OGAPHI_002557 [Ogataea philodendri]KAH3668802.1 hypothetical protein OGAPHI_002557 [Ogataea philodendri]